MNSAGDTGRDEIQALQVNVLFPVVPVVVSYVWIMCCLQGLDYLGKYAAK